jgi:hypothetical protein
MYTTIHELCHAPCGQIVDYFNMKAVVPNVTTVGNEANKSN